MVCPVCRTPGQREAVCLNCGAAVPPPSPVWRGLRITLVVAVLVVVLGFFGLYLFLLSLGL